MESKSNSSVPKIESCFACGPANPYGLHLKIEEKDGIWETCFIPAEHHCGWPGIVHGGILSTVLDEVMSYAVMSRQGTAVTVRLTVEFKRACAPGAPVLFKAWPTRVSRRIVEAHSEARLEDETLVASAEGKFLVLSEEQKNRMIPSI